MKIFIILKRCLGIVESETLIGAPNALTAINIAMAQAGFDPMTPLAGVSWTAVAV